MNLERGVTPVRYRRNSVLHFSICAITFAENLSWFTGYSSQARSDWTTSGRVGFVSGGSLPQLFFDDSVCDPQDPSFAYTEVDGPQKHIHYNRYHLDGDPTRTGACAGNRFARLSWRHMNRAVANHELGHALGLGHTINIESVVHPTIDHYFKLNIETYTMSDQVRLNQIYPNTCP